MFQFTVDNQTITVYPEHGQRSDDALFQTVFVPTVLRDIILSKIGQAGFDVSASRHTPNTSGISSIPIRSVKLPFILLINGPGRSGKDSFVDIIGDCLSKKDYPTRVCSVSTVDKIYAGMNAILEGEARIEIQKQIQAKADQWRQFMHELKMSWSKFCDGPYQYILREIYHSIYNNIEYSMSNPIEFVTVMTREPDEIYRMIDHFTTMGLMTFSIFIDGITKSSDYKNDCDSNVDGNYDIYFTNNLNQFDMFKKHVVQFVDILDSYWSETYSDCLCTITNNMSQSDAQTNN